MNKIKKHIQDQTSVLAWIEEWASSDDNPVLFYKLQGQKHETLEDKDFVIVLQTKFEARMLRELGHKGVCCDATHGTAGYDFKLSSLLVLDEFSEGVPAGHVLSNREDYSVLKIFFQHLRALKDIFASAEVEKSPPREVKK